MDKQRKERIAQWIWVVALLLFSCLLAFRQRERINPFTEEEFLARAEVADREDITRAKIWLKHTVHGTDGVYYRYVVETDCPNWNFETRYVSKSSLDWVTDETSAVEVLVHSVQVSLPGEGERVYASGEYYTVPILGDLASEDIPLEEWKENLVANAYSAYLAEKKAHDPLLLVFLILAAASFVYLVANAYSAYLAEKKAHDPLLLVFSILAAASFVYLVANAYSAYLAEKKAHDPLLPVFLILAAVPFVYRLVRKKSK